MEIGVNFTDRTGQTKSAHPELPDECPVCERLVVLRFSQSTTNNSKNQVQAVFQCPNPACMEFVFVYFLLGADNTLRFVRTEPPNFSKPTFPQFAVEISPTFVSIYNEAHEAKGRGLLQIAGPAYRKAFEFLIKDYAKSTSPVEKHASIENSLAGTVVRDFIADTRVQAVAKRALWVGNDETHYLRKWESKDINDLLTLVKLTLDWVEIERTSKAYIEEMPEHAQHR